jgi:hypothetical protein
VSPQEMVLSVTVMLNFYPPQSCLAQEFVSIWILSYRHRQSSLIRSSLYPWKGNSPGTIFVSLRQDRFLPTNPFNSWFTSFYQCYNNKPDCSTVCLFLKSNKNNFCDFVFGLSIGEPVLFGYLKTLSQAN